MSGDCVAKFYFLEEIGNAFPGHKSLLPIAILSYLKMMTFTMRKSSAQPVSSYPYKKEEKCSEYWMVEY